VTSATHRHPGKVVSPELAINPGVRVDIQASSTGEDILVRQRRGEKCTNASLTLILIPYIVVDSSTLDVHKLICR
jgi:hypothetical protein